MVATDFAESEFDRRMKAKVVYDTWFNPLAFCQEVRLMHKLRGSIAFHAVQISKL